MKNPLVQANEIHDFILAVPLFQRLFRNISYTSRLNLISTFQLQTYHTGEIIYSYGEPCNAIHVLLSGSVLLYSAHSDSNLLPVKILNDFSSSKSKVFTSNAMAKKTSHILKIDTLVYQKIVFGEIEENIKEKIKIVENVIPGISLCTPSQIEKIAYCLDVYSYPKGTILCREGVISDKLQILLEGECSILKSVKGKNKVVSKLGKGSFISENTALNGTPTDFTVISTSEKVLIGKFKNSDVQSNFPLNITSHMKNICKATQKIHEKILKFSYQPSINSLSAKYFPLASPRALSNISHITLRKANNFSCLDVKPTCRYKLEKLRDSSPLRINKFFGY